MRISSKRGFAQVWLVWVLAGTLVAGGAVVAKKTGAIFSSQDTKKVKEQAAQIAELDKRLTDAEQRAAALRKDADDARAKADALKTDRYGEVAANVSGVVYALEKEPEPSLNVQAGLALARTAQKLADPVAEARLQEMKAFVDKLTAQNEQIRKDAFAALKARDADVEAAHLREVAAIRDAAAFRAQADAKDIEIAKGRAELSGHIAQHERDSDKIQTLGQKLASWARWTVGVVGLFFFCCWVLPIIAKAHPEIGWLGKLAKGAGATFAWGLSTLHAGETKIAAGAAADAGKVLATLKAKTPEAAQDIERLFDNTIRPEAWKLVAAGRAEAEKLLSSK